MKGLFQFINIMENNLPEFYKDIACAIAKNLNVTDPTLFSKVLESMAIAGLQSIQVHEQKKSVPQNDQS